MSDESTVPTAREIEVGDIVTWGDGSKAIVTRITGYWLHVRGFMGGNATIAREQVTSVTRA